MNNYLRKMIFWMILISVILSSCSVDSTNNRNNKDCSGSFYDFAYNPNASAYNPNTRVTVKDLYTGNPINTSWDYCSSLPQEIQSSLIMYHKIYGERKTKDGIELWITSTYGPDSFFMADWNLLESKISVYEINKKEWKTISALVQDYECVANELFIDNDGNIWAKNAGNVDDDNYGSIPILSRYSQEKNAFIAVDATLDIFSGTKGEISEDLYDSQVIFDGIENIWIFSKDGNIYQYNILTNEIVFTDSIDEGEITSVAFDGKNNIFYIKNQISYESNILGIKNNFEILKYSLSEREILPNLPYYLPHFPDIYVDHNENLWFESFGYIDKEKNWNLIMPNFVTYWYHVYFNDDIRYQIKKILTGTTDGKIWFYGLEGIGWYDVENGYGCWDSIEGKDIYEDSSNKLWLITNDSLYSRNER